MHDDPETVELRIKCLYEASSLVKACMTSGTQNYISPEDAVVRIARMFTEFVRQSAACEQRGDALAESGGQGVA